MTRIRQILRLLGLAAVTLILGPLQALTRLFLKDKHVVARFWHRTALRICGIRVHVKGQAANGPVLFLANHISHLDISVLGGVLPMRFVSKQEVKSWPVFGTLAVLQDTIFIDRAPKLSSIKAAREAMQDAINKRARLVIFPEGTNTIGNKVLPFRRALLDNLKATGYRVQPVAIKCTAVDGQALHSQEDYEIYGWGDIGFGPHLWRVMGKKSIDVEVHFLPPVPVENMLTAEIVGNAEHAVRAAAVSL